MIKLLQMMVLLVALALICDGAKLRIGIVGGGIGGTSACYFLQELLHDQIIIDLYESQEIGGRLATTQVGNLHYETGGSIIHEDNLYVGQFMQNFNLTKKIDQKTNVPTKFGLYDGFEFLFKESGYSWLTAVKLLYRYGPLNFYRFQRAVNNMLEDFSHIYKLQQEKKSFLSLESLLRAMSDRFVPQLTSCAEDGMQAVTSQLLLSELVSAGNLVNYGQSMSSMPEFVTYVSCAGMSGKLFSISGGNKQLAENLLKSCSGNLLRRRVAKVVYQENTGTYVVHSVASGAQNSKGHDRWRKNQKKFTEDRDPGKSNESLKSANENPDNADSSNLDSGSESSGYESADVNLYLKKDSSESAKVKSKRTNGNYDSSKNADSTSSGYESEDQNADSFDSLEKEYDYLILATPLSLSDIEFVNVDQQNGVNQQSRVKYHTTVTTLVQGQVNATLTAGGINEILLVRPFGFLNSLSLLSSTSGDNSARVYKIFSQRALASRHLDQLFEKGKYEVRFVREWKAYPQYTCGEVRSGSTLTVGEVEEDDFRGNASPEQIEDWTEPQHGSDNNDKGIQDHSKNDDKTEDCSENNEKIKEHSKNDDKTKVCSENNEKIKEHSKNDDKTEDCSENNEKIKEHSKNDDKTKVCSENIEKIKDHGKKDDEKTKDCSRNNRDRIKDNSETQQCSRNNDEINKGCSETNENGIQDCFENNKKRTEEHVGNNDCKISNSCDHTNENCDLDSRDADSLWTGNVGKTCEQVDREQIRKVEDNNVKGEDIDGTSSGNQPDHNLGDERPDDHCGRKDYGCGIKDHGRGIKDDHCGRKDNGCGIKDHHGRGIKDDLGGRKDDDCGKNDSGRGRKCEGRSSQENSFVLNRRLYYVNVIELAASAMEMSVIGAHNVALLVYQDVIDSK